MSANTETTGADRTKCKAPTWCGFNCQDDPRRVLYVGADDGIFGVVSADGRRYCSPSCRDAPPPIAAPAAHVERRKGQRWRCVSPSGKVDEGTIANATLTGIGTWKMEGAHEEFWSDSYRWGPKSEFAMTLLADAPPEPAKCEPWCGNGLPPDDVCGYGFIDGPGDEREYFKLPGKSQRRKGYVYSWCSNECREKAEVPKSPPAQEAPKLRDVLCLGGCGLRIVLLSPLTWMCPTCIGKRAEAPKAAPVCGSNGELHGGEVLMRHFKKTKGYRCDHCFVLLENRHVGAGKFTGILRDLAVGERLPRPRLAADWVEECLPTVWR